MKGHLKVIQSGYTVEIWEYDKISTASRRIHTRKKKRVRKLIRPRSAYAARQRRSNFQRLVQVNLDTLGAPSLLTLTMRHIKPLKACWYLFRKFILRLKYRFPDLAYVCVPEFQKRGAVHFHVLIWGIPSGYVDKERSNRYIANLWRQGFIDLIHTNGKPALSGYLGKYLSKTFLDPRTRDQRCYTCSRNVERPATFNSRALLAFSEDVWGFTLFGDNCLEFSTEYGTKWLGRCVYKKFRIIPNEN